MIQDNIKPFQRFKVTFIFSDNSLNFYIVECDTSAH